MKSVVAIVSAGLVLGGGTAVLLVQNGRRTAQLDFESGSLSGWILKLAAPHSASVVSHPVRRGNYAVRFELRDGDDTGDGVRAELKESYHAPLNRDIWNSFSTLVPNDFPMLSRPSVISQWHAEEDAGEEAAARSPVLAHRFDGRLFLVDIRFSNEKTQKANDGVPKVLFEQKDFAREVWHDFAYRVRWSYREDGLVQGWLDGKQIIDYSGPVGYNDDSGPYFKFGIYHHSGGRPIVIYHDEYRRGFSRDVIAGPQGAWP